MEVKEPQILYKNILGYMTTFAIKDLSLVNESLLERNQQWIPQSITMKSDGEWRMYTFRYCAGQPNGYFYESEYSRKKGKPSYVKCMFFLPGLVKLFHLAQQDVLSFNRSPRDIKEYLKLKKKMLKKDLEEDDKTLQLQKLRIRDARKRQGLFPSGRRKK